MEETYQIRPHISRFDVRYNRSQSRALSLTCRLTFRIRKFTHPLLQKTRPPSLSVTHSLLNIFSTRVCLFIDLLPYMECWIDTLLQGMSQAQCHRRKLPKSCPYVGTFHRGYSMSGAKKHTIGPELVRTKAQALCSRIAMSSRANQRDHLLFSRSTHVCVPNIPCSFCLLSQLSLKERRRKKRHLAGYSYSMHACNMHARCRELCIHAFMHTWAHFLWRSAFFFFLRIRLRLLTSLQLQPVCVSLMNHPSTWSVM